MPAPTLTFGVLSQEHPEYDGKLYEKLRLLKCGGWEILKHADMFLERMPAESKEFYEWRKHNASYVNYIGPLIGLLTGLLFAKPLSVDVPADADKDSPGEKPKETSFWEEFGNDCDLSGKKFSAFAKCITQDALLYRRGLAKVDLPRRPDDVAINSLADEDKLNLRRVWVDHVPIEELINWKIDELASDAVKGRMRFAWVKFRRKVVNDADPLADQSKYRFHFEVWRMLDGVAHFEVWRSKEYDGKTKPRDDDEVELLTPLTATSFREIPFIQLDLGDELWLGNQAGPLAAEHYRDRSNLKGDMAKSLCEIPYIQKGPETGAVMGAFPSEIQQDPNRGDDPVSRYRKAGWLEIGIEDKIGFAGPSGVAHQMAKALLDDLRDEIYRTAHAMSQSLANNSETVGRSGDSKREDREATQQILKAIAEKVRGWADVLWTCAAEARGEDIAWSVSGIDSFDREDRPLIVEEASLIMALNIPSKIFKSEYLSQVAVTVLPNLNEQQKAEMRKEIADGLEEQAEIEEQRKELTDRADEANTQAAENAAKNGGPPVGKPPSGKPAKPGKAA